MLTKFFNWYEKHLTLNIAIAAFLFTLQLIHLYWLTTDVVVLKIFGRSFFHLEGIWQLIILLVDYTEIPALITTSLVYINEQRKKPNFKNLLFLFFLNSQFLHIFWITDEFVIEHFTAHKAGTVLPIFWAWVAILIDYLELPVIFDTIKKLIAALKKRDIIQIKEALKD
ncbi:hypothetical protein HYS93_02845 [Candidatus Daviesbacteria bacterium]|nr:hypothetical protein [Candidatus Daviesbacteria bacterium]